MGRTVSSNLQNILNLGSCETQSTLDIVPVSGSPIYLATKALTANSHTHTADLRMVDEVKQSVFTTPDRVNTRIQNVDKVIGGIIAAESLVKAVVKVGRLYTDPAGVYTAEWVELLRGEAVPGTYAEMEAPIEVLNDLAAAGYCVANWTLAENCQFVFKGTECAYAGGLTTCNKRRKSPDGCVGRANEHHFGGMEFPEPQTPSTPTGGDDPIDPGDDPGHNCPRIDQLVPALGSFGIKPRRADSITEKDWLYNPLLGQFSKVKSAEIVRGVQVWEIQTTEGVYGYSSYSHPVFPYREHVDGLRVSEFFADDPILLWHRGRRELIDAKVLIACPAGETGDVVRIELEDGHVYAYGDEEDLFIVCHNAKEPLLT